MYSIVIYICLCSLIQDAINNLNKPSRQGSLVDMLLGYAENYVLVYTLK